MTRTDDAAMYDEIDMAVGVSIHDGWFVAVADAIDEMASIGVGANYTDEN